MEHVAHVESVSNTIAKSLGLNDELTKAIAMGGMIWDMLRLDIKGELVIRALSEKFFKRGLLA